ncbi:MAG: PHB depolymerase family esterase, partial [Eubacteriales bacterium]
ASTLPPRKLAPTIYVLQDSKDEDDIEKCLIDAGLLNLAEKEKLFVIFPVAGQDGWNTRDSEDKANDLQVVSKIIEAATMWYLFPGNEKCNSYMMGMIGINKGTEFASVFASKHSKHLSSLLTFGGNLEKEAMDIGEDDCSMSVWAVNPKGDGYQLWMERNHLNEENTLCYGDTKEWTNRLNKAKRLLITTQAKEQTAGIISRYWYEIHSKTFRIPDTKNGKIFSMTQMMDEYNPCIYNKTKMLGDNNWHTHSWYEFVPKSISQNSEIEKDKFPLVVALHGGGDTHEIAVAMFKWHELGEKEGFITVYANASDDDSWNSMLYSTRASDIEYLTRLIEHITDKYPVDKSRIYLSGFSNGSGMAQVLSALRPDLIAGLVAFNTRFPMHDGVYEGARKAKEKYDYRVPVFSTYGTKDAEYPPREGSGQFSQMTFWKWYNNIEAKPLNGDDKSGAGTAGDCVVTLGEPSNGEKGEMTWHQYYSMDNPSINYYNYTVVQGLPHTVEQRLIPTAWEFIKKFSRREDGLLKID